MPQKYCRQLRVKGLSPLKKTAFRIRGADKVKEPAIGTLLADRYYLLSILGKGGMSIVFKAKDKLKRRILAVKTLRYQWADDGLTVKRFQREAQTLSLLRHPSIVSVHAFGETVSGQPYFVMDYLTGRSLGALLKQQGQLPIERVWGIFRRVFDAVQHAHNSGLVHRDLKPNNIMLTGQDKRGDVVKIVDFGIAKLQQEAQKLTRLGEVWGSPVYMSPEQCMGTNLDKRSDIYSLGICLFESLTGELPLLGKNYRETMMMQINQPPPRLQKVRPDLVFNEELEAVLIKALDKNPDQRFQTVKEFKSEMEAALDKMMPAQRRKISLEVMVRKPRAAVKNYATPAPAAAKSSEPDKQKSSKRKSFGTKPAKAGSSLYPREKPRLGESPILQRRGDQIPINSENRASQLRSNIIFVLFVILAACTALSYVYGLYHLAPDAEINKVPPKVRGFVLPQQSP
jgi:serine/threonine protein kinase